VRERGRAVSANVTTKQERLEAHQERVNQRMESLGFSLSSFLITNIVMEALILGSLFAVGLLQSNLDGVPIIALLALLPGSVFYFAVLFSKRLYFRFWQRNLESQVLSENASSLQEAINEENFFTNLVAINFKYIDKYYLQTQVQADKSFFLCMVAAVVSLFIIVIGILLMFTNKLAPAYLTTATGVVGEIIATVFFYLYNRTIAEMSEYHQKLVLTQNISLAMKIAQSLPEADRSKAQLGLIECLTKDINMYLCLQLAKDTGNGHTAVQALSKAVGA
jgi:uncharacterized membrane protein